MRIMIAIPCGDTVDTNTFVSTVNLIRHEIPGVQTELVVLSNSLVYDARNQLAQKAVSGGYDAILWIDSDMTFQPDLLERLLTDMQDGQDRDLVCGLFYSRRTFRPTMFSKCRITSDEEGTHIETELYKPIPYGIFEIEACGFAAVLTKTSIFKEILDKGGLPFSPMLGLGEDLSACIRVREFGHKLFCDSTIDVGHVSHLIIGGDDYRISWNETE